MARLLSKLFIVLISFVAGSCDKDDGNAAPEPPGFYFFRASVDSFAVEENFEPGVADNGRLAEGRTGISIPGRDGIFMQVSGATNRCSEAGYCFVFNLEIQGENTGTYTDSTALFSMTVHHGGSAYQYFNIEDIGSFTDLEVTITKIEAPSGQKPGYIEGRSLSYFYTTKFKRRYRAFLYVVYPLLLSSADVAA